MTLPDSITITINGQPVDTQKNATLMEAIEQTGIKTPVICFHPATTPEGICRQCVVEVEGWRTLVPACVTKVRKGWWSIPIAKEWFGPDAPSWKC